MASRQRDQLWTPFQVKHYALKLRATLTEIVDEYKQAHLYVHEQKDRHHPTEDERLQQTQVRRIRRTSDPTGDIVADQESNRRRLARAMRKLEHAEKEIEAAKAQINRVFMDEEDEYRRLEA